MPVVWIPALLRDLTGGEETVTVPGETVQQVIEKLDERYPGIKERLCEGGATLTEHCRSSRWRVEPPEIASSVDRDERGSLCSGDQRRILV